MYATPQPQPREEGCASSKGDRGIRPNKGDSGSGVARISAHHEHLVEHEQRQADRPDCDEQEIEEPVVQVEVRVAVDAVVGEQCLLTWARAALSFCTAICCPYVDSP